jgi:hypothetical protein
MGGARDRPGAAEKDRSVPDLRSRLDETRRDKERMTIRTSLLLAAIAVGLGGCGLYKWEKPGADDAAFKTDSAACQQVRNPDGFNGCMTSRGWTLD